MKTLTLALAVAGLALSAHFLPVTAAESQTVACWGDSITEGMAMKPDETYPARLVHERGKALGYW